MHLSLKASLGRSIITRSPSGILDAYPGTVGAYSLRALSSAWGREPVVNVRRSSDQLEEEFNASQVASGALATWVGAGNDGFVETWYDQSGEGNDAVQTVTGSQPKIVDAGVLVDGGILFDGVDDTLEANGVAPNFSGTDIPLSCFAVNNYASVPTGNTVVASLGNSSDNSPFFYFGESNTGQYRLFFRDEADATALIAFGSTAPSTNYLTSLFNDGASQAQFIDGGAAGTANIDLGSTPFNRFTIGALGRISDGNYANASVSEIIMYNSDQSAKRTAIEDNINNHYEIY